MTYSNKEKEMAKNKAIKLLAYHPRTAREISNRLEQAGYSYDIIDEVIEYLKEYNYINDLRYAESWIEHRLERGKKGKLYIYQELLKKGISGDIAEEVVSAITEEQEYKLMQKAAEDKLRAGQAWPALARYLERQGFARELIYKLYREWFEES